MTAKRLFIAIEVPREIRERVYSLSMRLKEQARDLHASWVPAENIHITVQFLGSTELEDEIEAKLRTVRLEPFSLALGGLGAFPGERCASVLWLGAGLQGRAGGEALSTLVGETARALEPLGFQAEKGAFSGHLTLAKVKKPTDISRLITPSLCSEAEFEPFFVKEILVLESKTAPKGAIYRELHRISLA